MYPADYPPPESQPVSEALTEARRIIASGDPSAVFDEDFLRLMAREGDFERVKVKHELSDAFKKDFRVRDWLTGIKDAQARMHQERPAVTEDSGWSVNLLRKRNRDGSLGAPLICEANALLYLENDPSWKGVIAYNEFTAEHSVRREPPEPLTVKPGEPLQDHHDTQIARWFQVKTEQPWPVGMVRLAMDCYARDNGYHPIRDYLDALTWDGKPRLKTWLFDFAGAGPPEAQEEVDESLMEFYAAAGARWMISAIARMRQPGCQVHHMLVLEGGEGLGKSTLVKTIGCGWSQEMTASVENKSAQELIASSVWIWELSELAALRKTAEVESFKAFISRPEETFRPAYGRRVIKHKRECAFIATVNGDQYLDSAAWEDGKRRVWPIRCTRPFDLAGLSAVIDQLWAEADDRYQAGERWHFDRDEDSHLIETAKREQVARVPENVNHSEFIAYARTASEKNYDWPGTVSVSEVLTEMKIPIERRKALAVECGKCLKSAGWRLEQPRDPDDKSRQLRRYRKP